jgi:cytochrome d ubiquinol oxidase subunit II
MKIAVASQNRRDVTGHTGRCRKFWIYDIQQAAVRERQLLELPKAQSFHESPRGIDGYHILSMPPADALPNPLAKVVEVRPGAWLRNYSLYPWMIAAPVVAFAGAALTILFSGIHRVALAFVTSGLAMAGVILTAGFSMFPFILPSSLQPGSSLTVWDAPSSLRTLTLMFWAAVMFVPIILAYTAWTYRAMWGKVTVQQIRDNTHSAY